MDNAISLGKEIDVFGSNIYVDRLKSHFKIKRILTSQTNPHAELINQDDPLIVVSSGRIRQAMSEALKFRADPIHVTALMKEWPEHLGDLLFNENGRAFFRRNSSAVEQVLQLFSDEQSRNEFLSLVRFRTDYDLRHLASFSDRQREQYFEPFLPQRCHGSFIDVGAYDGWTSKCFRERYGDAPLVIMMEPDQENLRALVASENKIENSIILPFAAGLTTSLVSFNSAGSASGYSEKGNQTIKVEPLDGLINLKVGMLKLDIEGGEVDAIKGAAQMIKRDRPVIATACYHSPCQLLEIPKLISRLGVDYRYYFRHYSESIYESVFFAVPQ